MKRLSLTLLLLIACAALAAPHLKVKHTPTALTEAQNYKAPADLPDTITLETFIGPMEITEPVLIELLNHPAMTRMKEIDQHGPLTYFGNYPTFSRYDHCIGVFALLRKCGRPLTEQIAGLLHDISHTVFSHVADHLFKVSNIHEHSYQDGIHNWYLHKMGIGKVLARYKMTVEEVNPDLPEFTALEQPRPRLCADRIQYILYTGLVQNHITQEQLLDIVDSLHFEDDSWVVTNPEHARTLADLSLHFAEHYWQIPENFAWNYWLCNALQQAIALELITSDDIHFGTDAKILELLNKSSDAHIKENMEKCRNWQDHLQITLPGQPYDSINYPKVMVVDPLVQLTDESTPILLSHHDEEYRDRLQSAKQRLSKSITLKLAVA